MAGETTDALADVIIKYNGQIKSELSASGTKTIKTGGKYCTGDIEVVYADPEKPTETKTVALSMASGNQVVNPTTGKVMTKVTVTKPATLLPENIKKGINIGGVLGTLESGGGGGGVDELPAPSTWGGTSFTLDKNYQISSNYILPPGYSLEIPEDCSLIIGLYAKQDLETVDYLTPLVAFRGEVVNAGQVYNFADMSTWEHEFYNAGSFFNLGYLTTGEYQLYKYGQFYNEGQFYNYGVLDGGYINNEGRFENKGHLLVATADAYNEGVFVNAGYIRIEDACAFYNNREFYNEAGLIEVLGIFYNANYASFEATDGSIINRSGGVITNYGDFDGGGHADNLDGMVEGLDEGSYDDWKLGGGGQSGFDPTKYWYVGISNDGSQKVYCVGNSPGEVYMHLNTIVVPAYRSGSLPKQANIVGIQSPMGPPSVTGTAGVEDPWVLIGMNTGVYYYLIFDDCEMFIVVSCFLPDTLITLADGSKKPIKDLTYSDELRVWDFDEGKFATAPICWLTKSGLHNGHYYKLTFSDGSVLKTTGHNSNHKVYNVDERYFKGVDKTEIGDRIFSENGIVTVVDKEYIEEDVEYYNLITTHKINCFAEGILTSDRYGNLYPIDENMVYIKDGRELRPYSEFEAVGIKRYWYDTLRLGEVSGTTEETKMYIKKLECQMLEPPLLGGDG